MEHLHRQPCMYQAVHPPQSQALGKDASLVPAALHKLKPGLSTVVTDAMMKWPAHHQHAGCTLRTGMSAEKTPTSPGAISSRSAM